MSNKKFYAINFKPLVKRKEKVNISIVRKHRRKQSNFEVLSCKCYFARLFRGNI